MKVNSNRDISFKSIYTNTAVKKGLELASENGALFGAAATVGFSVVRPAVIMLTPKADKENKKIAAAKSITSSFIGFLLMLGCSLPLSKGIKKIDKNPEKYLNKETIKSFKDQREELTNSKGYVFATQLFKLGLGALVAVPKSIITVKSMPKVIDVLDKDDNKMTGKNISFSAKPSENIASGVGKILNKNGMKKFTEKYKNTNFPMHITALTDLIATASFIHQTKRSDKIENSRKNALIYNAGISTALSVLGGYFLDKLLSNPTEKFIKNYTKANKFDKNLEKQIQGIKIAKPAIILGTIYYIFIPLISTFLAERADKQTVKYSRSNKDFS